MTETTPGTPRESGPLTRVQKTLFIQDNTYALVNPAAPPERFTDPVETGVVAITHRGGIAASVTCGTHIGDIRITTETWPTTPLIADEPWEDIAEISLPWPGGRMVLWSSDDDEPDEITLYEHAEPGSYRIRAHVRGRDLGEDRTEDDTPEEHLLQIWPAKPDQPNTLKTTDRTGAYWRSQHG
ncbi:hypothetical protein GCM10010372_78780 [Streptomyces tauricus]|uniref:hypothetical protein n=1 Tax=Streptomyces tauricus TaxID=68274 RepID=UPI001678B90C|nr:hypothetical protein [Streptomyces tauricus]GHA67469.1 hypothetical protein GCM10010372_78780 [Streptomyces tauricus]